MVRWWRLSDVSDVELHGLFESEVGLLSVLVPIPLTSCISHILCQRLKQIVHFAEWVQYVHGLNLELDSWKFDSKVLKLAFNTHGRTCGAIIYYYTMRT